MRQIDIISMAAAVDEESVDTCFVENGQSQTFALRYSRGEVPLLMGPHEFWVLIGGISRASLSKLAKAVRDTLDNKEVILPFSLSDE